MSYRNLLSPINRNQDANQSAHSFLLSDNGRLRLNRIFCGTTVTIFTIFSKITKSGERGVFSFWSPLFLKNSLLTI
jgi:hypothetical protein